MKKYSFKAIAALFLVVIMCLSFIPAAFAVMNDGYTVDTTECAHNGATTHKDKVDATCTEDGIEACDVCNQCGAVVNAGALVADNYDAWKNGDGKIKALGHDYTGTNPYECTVCHTKIQFDVETKGTGIKSKTTKTNGGEACEVTLEADTGYKNPVFRSVTVDGTALNYKEADPTTHTEEQKDYDKNSDSKITVHADKVTGKIVVTGEAPPNEYKISYNLDGGNWVDNDSPKKETHTYGTLTKIEDTDPTKAGYTFKGWKINNGAATESPVTLDAEGYTADITLTAAWEENTVGITVVNGTIKDNATTIKASDKLQITAKDLEGKRFVGWKVTQPTDEELARHVTITSKTASPAMVSVDATFTDAGNPVEITAEYKLKISYEYNDGSKQTVDDPENYDPGEEVTIFDGNPPAPANQVFKCWVLNGTEYKPGAKYTLGNNGVTFVAEYVDKTFEVTPAYLEFYAYEGDTKAPAFQSVSIKNIGDSSVTVTLPTSTDKYIVCDTATQPITFNTVTIPAGETYKIKVRPADPADKYKEDDSFIDYLTIANDAGQKEKVGILFEVTKPLKVRINPETLEKNCGESASFTANPTGGAGGYSYQWQVKLPGKDSYTDLYDNQKLCTASTSDCACVVSGANSRTLTLNYAVCKVDGYKFRCVVTDAEDNTVTSGGASLRVKIRGQKEYDKYNYQCTHCGEISPKIKTGDESMPILWASLAGVSLVALTVGAVYYFRKKKKNT